MARSTKQKDYYREFADKLIDRIKAGTAPWQKPWEPGETALPENVQSERSYTGGNTLYLAMAAEERGYSDNRWGTYRQIKAMGGHVKKGERGEHIVFFSRQKRLAQRDADGKVRKNRDGKTLYDAKNLDRPVWRTYVVFNAEQTKGLKLPSRGDGNNEPPWMPQKRAEAVIAQSGVDIRHQHGNRASYHLKNDQVTLPERNQFPSSEKYYQTALHELGHATGHTSRLDRDTLKEGIDAGFGSEQYAREELRAEIGAMMTGDRLRTGHNPDRGAAYVEGWVKALEDDPREIHRAASDAQRMSNYLLDRAREQIEEIDQHHEQARGETAPDQTREPGRADKTDRPAEKQVEAPQRLAAMAGGPDR